MWYVWLSVVLAVLLVVGLPVSYVLCKRHYWWRKGVPYEQPPAMLDVLKTLFGFVVYMDWAEHEHYQQLYQQFKGTGPFCGFYRMLQPRALILDRELIAQILIKDFSNFNDRGIYHNTKHDPLSADLYSRRGDEWKEMRLRLEPIFGKDVMRSVYGSMLAAGEPWLGEFDKLVRLQVEEGGYIEIRTQMRRYVLAVIALCVFDLSERRQLKYPLDMFGDMTHLALNTTRHSDFLNAVLRRHPQLGQRFQITTTSQLVEEYFVALIADAVRERELERTFESAAEPNAKANAPLNYMQLLVDIMTQELSTHESGERSVKEIKQHLMEELAAHAFSFLKAGLKPTTNTLTQVLYELALNESVQEQVRQEVQGALGRHNNELTYDCVHELKFMGQVISETLRIHPVTPYLIRRTLTEYPVQKHTNYRLCKDMFVIIPTHAIHTDPAYYPDPYIFKPERFASVENRQRDQCMWLGFGDGPRSCLGLHFAQLQMRILLARLLTKYRFAVDRTRLMMKHQNVVTLRVEPIAPKQTDGQESSVSIYG